MELYYNTKLTREASIVFQWKTRSHLFDYSNTLKVHLNRSTAQTMKSVLPNQLILPQRCHSRVLMTASINQPGVELNYVLDNYLLTSFER